MKVQRQAIVEDALLEPELAGMRHDKTVGAPGVAERTLRLDGDRYRLHEPLQQTDWSATWCAWDAPLERMVALRVFRCPSDDFLEALARDINASRHVTHRHVQRIERYGRCATSGLIFVEAELCAEFTDGRRHCGKTLAETHPRSARQAAQWAREIALGVHAAHEKHVFHGGLTSDCIWIRPQTGRAQVAHFGRALWRRADPARGSAAFSPHDCVTLDAPESGGGGVCGAPCYMAPEQAMGTASNDDDGRTRVDVYGIGAVLHEMLFGAPPYLPGEDAADPVQDVLSQVRAHPPRPRSRRQGLPAGELLAVPDQLGRILARSMARTPTDRHASAAELAADLGAFLDRRPTHSDGLRPGLRAWLWTRRHAQAIGLSLSVIISLLATVAALSRYPELIDARQRLHRVERETRVVPSQRREPAEGPELEPAP